MKEKRAAQAKEELYKKAEMFRKDVMAKVDKYQTEYNTQKACFDSEKDQKKKSACEIAMKSAEKVLNDAKASKTAADADYNKMYGEQQKAKEQSRLKKIRDTKEETFKGVNDEVKYLTARLNFITTEIKNLDAQKGKASSSEQKTFSDRITKRNEFKKATETLLTSLKTYL